MKLSQGKALVLSAGLVIGVTTAKAATSEYEEVIYYHNDALGSPIAATDVNGELLWRETYSPYGSRLQLQSRETDCGSGNCIPLESSWDEKQWFTGKLEETRVGIQYYGARWYEPELGRFLSVDPVPFQEDNVFSFNRYAYANGNPYRYVDPDGREVVQVGVFFSLPQALGIVQAALGREITTTGVELGLAWSWPGKNGKGEYDIGAFITTQLNGEGIDTGKFALTYSHSVDPDASLKDLPGVGGGASVGLGTGGFNATYSTRGLESVGIYIGPGIGISARAEATAIVSKKHGQLGWSNSGAKDQKPKNKVQEK
jgi:RHS repeat-associated protein